MFGSLTHQKRWRKKMLFHTSKEISAKKGGRWGRGRSRDAAH